jgi:dolichyl-phosphate beta-glucosyltransferase
MQKAAGRVGPVHRRRPLGAHRRTQQALGCRPIPNADGAIGSRALDRSLIGVHQSVFRETSGKFFNLVMRLITGLPYRDTQCGFKLFSRPAAAAVAARQRIEGFGFDVEILFIAKKHHFHILEVPVRWNNVEGTKVSLWNGLQAFLDPLEVRRNDLRGLYR